MATPRKGFRTHQVQGGGVEAIQYMQYATGQTFPIGAVLIYAAGEVTVAGADPASNTIVGYSLQGAGTSPGYDAANSPTTFTGRQQKVSVVRPNDQLIVQGEFTNGSSTLIASAQSDVGVSYGITAYTGVWTVDKNKTGGSARVIVTGFDADQFLVFFKFIQPLA